jgi:hypothetical protein
VPFIILLFISLQILFSQSNAFVFPQNEYQTSIKSPQDFHGYAIGEFYTQHHNVMKYMAYLHKSFPENTQWINYGKSYQGRDLQLLVISSKNNMARIDDIKKENQGIAAGNGKNAEIPSIVWLGYNVHGNETSSSEAAMLAAYHFLAGNNAEHRKTLDNIVIIIDPMMNPDGRERFISFFKNRVGSMANPDMNAMEHSEPWPSGRVNHYMFDLNRDWTWASQVETQTRLKVYHEFKPHVFVDFHEMGVNSAYFFFPAAKPFNPYLPKSTQKWGDVFGNGNAKIMDEHKRLYYRAEWFDLFYPGYGDSYPSMNGSIGMTYEQAGHSRGGRAARRNDGSVLTLEERAFNHYRTSVSTVRTALENKTVMLNDFASFFKNAKARGAKENFRNYIVDMRGNYDEFLRILKHHDLDISYASKDQRIKLNNGKNYNLKAGQAIIPVEQAQYILLQNLMDKEVSIPDTAFYDLSSWSLPLAFNIDVYKTKEYIQSKNEAPAKPQFAALKEAYAYIFTPDNVASYRLFNALQDHGIKLRATNGEIKTAGKHYAAGSVLITAQRNRHIKNLAQILSTEANAAGIAINALETGRVEIGSDLGSDAQAALPQIKILLVAGENMSSNATGATWHLFDQVLKDQITMVSLKRLRSMKLSPYTTIILSSGYGIKSALGESGIKNLKTWIREGGHLIGTGSGASFLTKESSKLTAISAPKEKKKKEPSKERLFLKYKDRKDYFSKRSFPGAFLGTDVDESHPLMVGVSKPLFVLKTNRSLLKPSESAHNIIRFNTKKIYGFVPENFDKKAQETAVFQYMTSGRGAITMINADPSYRAFTYGLTQLFLNAVYLGNAGF